MLPAQLSPLVLGADVHNTGQIGGQMFVPMHPPPISTSVATLRPQAWNRVTVCHVEDGFFWLHEDQQSEELADIEMAMAEIYQSAGNSAAVAADQVNAGAWFGALYVSEEDEANDPIWTRAIVQSTEGGRITVTHADYGSTATVDVSELRLLKPEFLSLPSQAIRCQLNGTEGYTAQGAVEQFTKALQRLLDFGTFFCSLVRDADEEGACVVNLYDETGQNMQEKVHEWMAQDVAAAASTNELPAQSAAPEHQIQNQSTETATPTPAAPTQAPIQPSKAPPAAQNPATQQVAPQKPAGPAWGGKKNSKVLQAPTKEEEEQLRRTAAAAAAAAAPAGADADGWVEVAKKDVKKAPSKGQPPQGPSPPGFVFHCSSVTVQECLDRELFGLPRKFIDMMAHIKPALDGETLPTVLFLFNLQKNHLYGPFEAVSQCALDIDPDAWKVAMKRENQRGSPFAAQVRVRWTHGKRAPVNMPSRINIGPVNPTVTKTYLSKLEG